MLKEYNKSKKKSLIKFIMRNYERRTGLKEPLQKENFYFILSEAYDFYKLDDVDSLESCYAFLNYFLKSFINKNAEALCKVYDIFLDNVRIEDVLNELNEGNIGLNLYSMCKDYYFKYKISMESYPDYLKKYGSNSNGCDKSIIDDLKRLRSNIEYEVSKEINRCFYCLLYVTTQSILSDVCKEILLKYPYDKVEKEVYKDTRYLWLPCEIDDIKELSNFIFDLAKECAMHNNDTVFISKCRRQAQLFMKEIHYLENILKQLNYKYRKREEIMEIVFEQESDCLKDCNYINGQKSDMSVRLSSFIGSLYCI